jgi:hypothetical protein
MMSCSGKRNKSIDGKTSESSTSLKAVDGIAISAYYKYKKR